MKAYDEQVVAGMTTEKLIQLIRDASPDKKDTMRAADIKKLSTSRWDDRRCGWVNPQAVNANKQLKAITDTAKFYRRAKAFLLQEIDISLSGTIFWKQNQITAKEFFKDYKEMVKNNRTTLAALDALD